MTVACGDGKSFSPPPAAPLGPPLPPSTAASRAAFAQQVHDIGVDRYVDQIHPVTVSEQGDWMVYHYPVSTGAGCLDDSDYLVSVRPASAPTGNVMLFLQGGGACWTYETCFGVPLATQTATVPSGNDGIFDWTNPNNPVAGHDIVFASYCDGSVFSGDNIANYGARHWGLRNISAAMTLLKDRYGGDLERLDIVGSSAGGFGTLMAMGLARGVFPDAQLYVFNDSGPGLENPALRDDMGKQLREGWRFTQFLPQDCAACEQQLTYLIGYQLDRDDRMRVAMYSYRDDWVIGSLFLRLYSDYGPLLRQVTDDIHNRHPERFKRFFVDGTLHTIVTSPQYTQAWPHGQRVDEWHAAFLTGAPTWVDRR